MDNIGCVQLRPQAHRKPKKQQPKDKLHRHKQAEGKKWQLLNNAFGGWVSIHYDLVKKERKRKEEQSQLDEEGAAIAGAVALKDELDRFKWAKKKRRQLKKASTAILSVLEKKKEEQQRLDKEGVALHVLCKHLNDSCQIVLKKNEGFEFDPQGHAGNNAVLMGGWKAGTTNQSFARHPVEGLGGWVSGAFGSDCKWNGWEFGSSTPGNGILRRDAAPSYFEERGQGAEVSAAEIVADAVSALQIED